MMFGKLIDNDIKRFKPPIKADGEDIYTNDPQILLEYGWKEVVATQPEEKEGYYPSAHYEDAETQIVQRWEYLPIESEAE